MSNSQFEGLFGEKVERTIQKAKDGDLQAARMILRWFVGAIDANTKDGKPLMKPSGSGTRIDERILRYLADCFRKVLKSYPPDAALNLKKPRHREPDIAIAKRNEMIALDMAIEIAKGEAPTDASTIVAENWKAHSSFKGISLLRIRETVRKAYSRQLNDDPLLDLKVKTVRRFKYSSRK